jgi:perosamine synthetase
MSNIPLSVPSIQGNEWNYIKECLDTEWVSSAGKYVDLFEEKISKYTGAQFAIACVNGTSALQVSLRLAGVEPGDEVIVPTLTFIAPVNAIAYNNAAPVFMDADQYYNIDIEKTINFIHNNTVFKNGFTYNRKTNNRISAILPVHIWGNAVLLDHLVDICEARNISIVEDASESLGSFYCKGRYKGRHTGTIGTLGCLSFNGNKIITSGGGGMILTNDNILADKARYLTTQSKDDPIRYMHHEIGYNFRLTNIQAALGVAQLEQLQGFLKRKKEIHNLYQREISGFDGLSVAAVPNYAENNHWMNLIQIDRKIYHLDRESLMKNFANNGIQTRPVWGLNHLQKPYQKFQSHQIEMSENLAKNSLCLPSSSRLKNEDIKTVITQLYE